LAAVVKDRPLYQHRVLHYVPSSMPADAEYQDPILPDASIYERLLESLGYTVAHSFKGRDRFAIWDLEAGVGACLTGFLQALQKEESAQLQSKFEYKGLVRVDAKERLEICRSVASKAGQAAPMLISSEAAWQTCKEKLASTERDFLSKCGKLTFDTKRFEGQLLLEEVCKLHGVGYCSDH